MIKKTTRCISAALALYVTSCSSAYAAAEFQYFVYPVGGITGISQSAGKVETSGPKYGGMINEKYADQFFDAATQQALIQSFKDGVAKQFPTSVVGANQIRTSKSGKYAYQPYETTQCSPGFTVNYKDSFAIAMGISRLSTYFNTYSDFTQVLVPITYTVRFVKLNGASVVFSKSETIYSGMTALTNDFFKPGTRDIKPENIIFKGTQENIDIGIVDLGFATFEEDYRKLFVRCGTPGYVAPEVLNDKDYTCKADVFSAGIIFYIM